MIFGVVQPALHVLLIVNLALGLHLVIQGFRNACDQVPLTRPIGFLVNLIVNGFVGLDDICNVLLRLDRHLIGVGVVVPVAGDALLGVYIKQLFFNHKKKGQVSLALSRLV